MIRRDIDSYTDSIPVGPYSPLWPMLWNTLKGRWGAPLPDWSRRALEEIVRPEVFAKSGGRVRHIRGVPTGQPVSCVLFNFYLHELDRRLEAVPGAFYARYSDDLLFVHPDPESVVAAARMIDEAAASLELRIKAEKSLELYVTAPGRASPVRESARPGSSIPFLGAEVWMDGTIGLAREKVRSLLRDLRDRAERTVQAGPGTDLDEAGRAICAVFNRALRPESGAFRQRSADVLRRVVTSRAQLKDLDDKIARIVVRALTGAPASRAFRRVSYRKVRGEWGLVSLCHGRNIGVG